MIRIGRSGSAVRLFHQGNSAPLVPTTLRDQGLALEDSFIGLERGMLGTKREEERSRKAVLLLRGGL